MSLIRSALKQPVLHFALVGAALFGVDALLRDASEPPRITPVVRSEVTAQLQQTLNRTPSELELRQGLDDWLDTELLYHEATELGLERNDAVIRAHLASKLRHIVRERSVLDEPTKAELEAQLESNRAHYTTADTFELTHAFVLQLSSPVEHQARVEEVLTELRAGTDPRSVGDHFPRGPKFSGVTQLQMEQILGAKLAHALPKGRLAKWQAVAGSRGTHFIRLDAIVSGEPRLEVVRKAVVADVQERKKEAAARLFTQELREKYRVESASP